MCNFIPDLVNEDNKDDDINRCLLKFYLSESQQFQCELHRMRVNPTNQE